MTKRSHHLILR